MVVGHGVAKHRIEREVRERKKVRGVRKVMNETKKKENPMEAKAKRERRMEDGVAAAMREGREKGMGTRGRV